MTPPQGSALPASNNTYTRQGQPRGRYQRRPSKARREPRAAAVRKNSSCVSDHCAPGLQALDAGISFAIRKARAVVGPAASRPLRHEGRITAIGTQAHPVKGRISSAQVQRRTLTPSTTTVLQTTAGLRTTTAPPAPAQPARTTPRAQTTAFASVVSNVMVAEKDSKAAAISRKERI